MTAPSDAASVSAALAAVTSTSLARLIGDGSTEAAATGGGSQRASLSGASLAQQLSGAGLPGNAASLLLQPGLQAAASLPGAERLLNSLAPRSE